MSTKQERTERFRTKNIRRRAVKKALGKNYGSFRLFTTGMRSVIGSDGKPARAINGAYGNIRSAEIIDTKEIS